MMRKGPRCECNRLPRAWHIRHLGNYSTAGFSYDAVTKRIEPGKMLSSQTTTNIENFVDISAARGRTQASLWDLF